MCLTRENGKNNMGNYPIRCVRCRKPTGETQTMFQFVCEPLIGDPRASNLCQQCKQPDILLIEVMGCKHNNWLWDVPSDANVLWLRTMLANEEQLPVDQITIKQGDLQLRDAQKVINLPTQPRMILERRQASEEPSQR